ncbi:MAG: formate--tetrahydrofolate ligase [Eggerthellaceae bacterium]|nr:formate--tetrahydrofolate ligase [Eggerthellaceae bacterium]
MPERTPAFIHGRPFAIIAHYCNSIMLTNMVIHLSNYAITGAIFAVSIDTEKFINIK